MSKELEQLQARYSGWAPKHLVEEIEAAMVAKGQEIMMTDKGAVDHPEGLSTLVNEEPAPAPTPKRKRKPAAEEPSE